MFEIVGGMIVLTLMILLSGLKTVKEYDQMVIFRFGKVVDCKGPGMQLVVPLIDRAQLVDTRVVTLPVPMVEEITVDNYTVKISALCFYHVVDAAKSVTKVDNLSKATAAVAQSSLRNIVEQHTIGQLLAQRRSINSTLKASLEKKTREWGVRIKSIEIKDLKIPREMKKALARSNNRHEVGGRHSQQATEPGTRISLGQLQKVGSLAD